MAEPHACPDAFTRAAWYQVVSQETVDNIIKEVNNG
jgi:(2Fe-2S) ferredoxin